MNIFDSGWIYQIELITFDLNKSFGGLRYRVISVMACRKNDKYPIWNPLAPWDLDNLVYDKAYELFIKEK